MNSLARLSRIGATSCKQPRSACDGSESRVRPMASEATTPMARQDTTPMARQDTNPMARQATTPMARQATIPMARRRRSVEMRDLKPRRSVAPPTMLRGTPPVRQPNRWRHHVGAVRLARQKVSRSHCPMKRSRANYIVDPVVRCR